MRGDALQTFKIIGSPNQETFRKLLTVFRRKYVKPQSMATAKRTYQRLVFNPAKRNAIDFSSELQKLAKLALGVTVPTSLSNSYMARCLHNWRNLLTSPLGERTTPMNRLCHILKGFWAEQLGSRRRTSNEHSDAMPQNQMLKNRNRHALTVKKHVTIKIIAVRLGERKNKPKAPKIELAIITVVKQTLTRTIIWLIVRMLITIHTTEKTKNRELSTRPVRHLVLMPSKHSRTSSWVRARCVIYSTRATNSCAETSKPTFVVEILILSFLSCCYEHLLGKLCRSVLIFVINLKTSFQAQYLPFACYQAIVSDEPILQVGRRHELN